MEKEKNATHEHANQNHHVLIVNGREKPWKDKTITFEQVVLLAF